MPVQTRWQARQQQQLEEFKNSINSSWQEAQESHDIGYSKFMDLINEEKRHLDQQYNEAKAKGSEVPQEIKDRASIVVDKLEQITHENEHDWTDTISEGAENLWHNVKDYASSAGEKVHDVYEEAKQIILYD